MRAVVLVGGQGTRLRPLTLSTPKPMLPVAELPLIERVLRHLSSHGIDEVILSLGYKPDAFLAAFPDGSCGGVKLTYAVEPEPMDTAGAIRFAADAAGVSDRFLVVNGDVLTDLDITALAKFHAEAGAEATIALTPVDDPSAFGVVPTDADGRVEAFIEKPSKADAPTNFINAGFYVMEASVLERIPAGTRVNVERETFPAMVADATLYAVGDSGYWTDTGTPALYLQASIDLVTGRRSGPPTPDARAVEESSWVIGAPTLDGEVVRSLIGDGASVGEGAVVRDAVVSGSARIAPGATVERCVVLAGALVEEGAIVRDSILGPGSVVHTGAVVSGLSVVGAGVVVAPGASHDNARLAP